MDEQNKNTETGQNMPTGFDSVSNITPQNNEGQFNPTEMFAKLNKGENNGYTLSGDGGFFEQEEKVAEQTKEATDEKGNEREQTPDADTLKSNEADSVKLNKDFLPSGTYSYSAAKGNLPDSAVNEPVAQPEPKVEPAVQNTPPTEERVYRQAYKSHFEDEPVGRNNRKNKKKYGGGVVVVSVILALVLGLGGGFAGAFLFNKFMPTNNKTSTPVKQNVTNIVVDETVGSTIEAVAKKAGPSVIGIRTTAAVTNFFFGTSEATEEGSGIVYTADGYIITNYHVISSAVESSNSKVEVFLPDDTENSMTATVVGYNISYDLAVVKVDATNLTPIELADSDKLAVGQSVIAIGNPGGLEFIGSVSTGVVSGLNRSITVDNGSTMSLIQTDAAINPGNSGGALVNTEGKLVGVNSVKLVSTGYEGMGFAIPSNKVKEICDKIISKQNDPTPYIGIQISQTYTADQLKALGYPAGAVVSSVVEGAPAASAGIQRGDIITEFNGVAINNYTDLDGALADCKPGDSATVKIYRAGRFYSTNVNIGANNAQ